MNTDNDFDENIEDDDFDEKIEIYKTKLPGYYVSHSGKCIAKIVYMDHNMLGAIINNEGNFFDYPPATATDLFLILCHKKMRKTIRQKDYDKIIDRVYDFRNNAHMLINYLIVKHDISIIIKMHSTMTRFLDHYDDSYFDNYVLRGIN